MRFNGRFLRIEVSPDRDPAIQGPRRRFLPWIGPKHIRKTPVQNLIALELALDLIQKRLRYRRRMTEYPYRYVGIFQHLLYRACECNQGRLVVFACPQIQVSIGRTLNFPAPGVQPWVQTIN